MKYHFHLLSAAADCLNSVFYDNRYADKAIEFYFKKNRKWGSRDRRFFAELVYDCVRWWKKYWFLLDRDPKPDGTLLLLGVSLVSRGLPAPEFREFQNFNEEKIKQRMGLTMDREIEQSIPFWLNEYGKKDLGDAWDETLPFLNIPNQVVLRTNTSLTDPAKLITELKSEGISAKALEGVPTGLILEKRANVFQTEAFRSGLFEVQDGSSQQVAPFLQVEPGMRVVDACAGAGGKTLHIATSMNNKGKVIALDIHQWKLDELKKRARRNKISIIEPKVIENSKVTKRLKESVDRLLLDVPCTGIGVLRRNPDTKWKLSQSRIDELLATQKEILQSYSKMVKPGGKMVYATCSLFRSENEEQVKNFMKDVGDAWELEDQKRILPKKAGFDGFFMARFLKKPQ